MLARSLLLLCGAAFVGTAVSQDLPWIKTSASLVGRMVDSSGRVRIFHGVNAGVCPLAVEWGVSPCPTRLTRCWRAGTTAHSFIS